MDSLSLILPCYNEASRLPRTVELIQKAIRDGIFSEVKLDKIWIIDDGSRDATLAVAKSYLPALPILAVHSVKPNQGKGNAIHEGLLLCQSDWCLIADADSATPWDQFKKLFSASKPGGQISFPISMGSRDLPESEIQTEQSWIREHMGKTFNFLVRMITGLPYKDTQCGFKLVHLKSVQNFLPKLVVKRFAWDVEFLMFARTNHVAIAEVPVSWAHQDASRVNPIKDSSEMLFRVIQMRLRILFSESTR
jgi:dolichyl-phosphate beta-glucosyltransferase